MAIKRIWFVSMPIRIIDGARMAELAIGYSISRNYTLSDIVIEANSVIHTVVPVDDIITQEAIEAEDTI